MRFVYENLPTILYCSRLLLAQRVPVEASAQLTKVTTSYVSDSAGVLPLWLAKEAGIFARNGLDVQAVRVHASVGVMALMSGELQFVLASGPVVVDSALRGSNAVYVAGGMSTLDFVLVTRPEIKTAEQLKGSTVELVGLQRRQSNCHPVCSTEAWTGAKRCVSHRRWRYQRKNRQLALGKNSRNAVQPAAKYHGAARRLQRLGGRGGAWPAIRAYWRGDDSHLHPGQSDIVRRYVKSHIEAISAMKTDREMAIKTLAKYLGQIKDRDVLIKSYEAAVPDNRISRKQYPYLAGLQMALDLLAEENPKAKGAKPEDFVDSRFIKELDDSGYHR
mgnify:CR=1 FL=1